MNPVQRLQAFRYELRPNGQQARQMRRFAGACRFVFNQALALQQERRAAGEKRLTYAQLSKALTGWKKQPELLWLNDTPSQALQQALKNRERACTNFFEKRAAFPRFKKKGQSESFRYPRRMACRTKLSSNWKKAKAKVQQPHTRIANCRNDFLHEATAAISQTHALVCIEDLRIGNLSRSARGSKEKPSRNVKAKSGLNRSIMDQGWYEFRRQLQYKLEWAGAMLVAVPPHNTSRAKVARPKRAASRKQKPTEATCVQHGAGAGAVGIPCL